MEVEVNTCKRCGKQTEMPFHTCLNSQFKSAESFVYESESDESDIPWVRQIQSNTMREAARIAQIESYHHPFKSKERCAMNNIIERLNEIALAIEKGEYKPS